MAGKSTLAQLATDCCRTAPASAGALTRRAALVALAMCSIAAALAPQAHADWRRVALEPSATEPYFACPARPQHAHCALIEDPTRGTDTAGQVRAGAITQGPELEASPAFDGNGMEGGYSPQQLQEAYGFPSESSGYGQTVAVVDAYDDRNAESDLSAYRSHYKLPECSEAGGCFRKISQSGGSTTRLRQEATWTKEISLDLDMVSAICPNCHILLVEAENEEASNLAAAENEAVKAGATEISNSYDIPEASEPPEINSAYDHPGIPITAAGGDDAYAAGVESPAADPNVIAVGGTSLLPASNSRGWTEEVWFTKSDGRESGTGSGCSEEPKPSWQKDTGCPYRTINDVAAVGDPNTPVSAYDSEETRHWLDVGGTSVSAPIVAAAMALANAYTKSFDGAAALYLDHELDPSAFNFVAGKNGKCAPAYLCEAGADYEYDGPTGLGSLHGVPTVPPPSAKTEAPQDVETHSATLTATVNPEGAELERCEFEYGEAGSSMYSDHAPCSTTPHGTAATAVTAGVSSLKPDTPYTYRIALAFHHESTDGSVEAFKTNSAPPPSASTGTASAITQTSATLNGTVDPEGEEVSACFFELSTSGAPSSKEPCTPAPGSGDSPTPVEAAISGLSPDVEYSYRIVAEREGVRSEGETKHLVSLPDAPTLTTEAAGQLTEDSATLHATVNGNGASVTSCEFQYGAGSTLSGTVPCAGAPSEGAGATAVSASLSGLAPGHSYSYRVIAENAGGQSYGAIRTFTTSTARSSSTSEQSSEGSGLLEPPAGGDGPLSPLTGGSESPLPVRVELASASLSASRAGVFFAAVRCEAEQVTSCPARIVVRIAPHGAVLAGAMLSLATGKLVRVRLRLSPRERQLLARHRKLRVSVAIASMSAGGQTTEATVTLRRAR